MPKRGRLAQFWLERLLDMQEVTRSSRVPPIYLYYEFRNLKQILISWILRYSYWVEVIRLVWLKEAGNPTRPR